jgi:hypothetical protein
LLPGREAFSRSQGRQQVGKEMAGNRERMVVAASVRRHFAYRYILMRPNTSGSFVFSIRNHPPAHLIRFDLGAKIAIYMCSC